MKFYALLVSLILAPFVAIYCAVILIAFMVFLIVTSVLHLLRGGETHGS